MNLAPVKNEAKQGLINHVAFVLDQSSSMDGLRSQVVTVTDHQIKSMASLSQALDQETRATVYTFADRHKINCIYYDKDVLRLPSLQGHYNPYGNTALATATLRAISDLEQSATLYGDHSFLLFVVTDGAENNSGYEDIRALGTKLASLPEHWTVVILVPNASCSAYAKQLGFAPGNIQVWDPTPKGIEEVSRKLDDSISSYMTMRSTGGFRGTNNIFSLDPNSVRAAVQQGALKQLDKKKYKVYTVQAGFRGEQKIYIHNFVERVTGKPYKQGTAFYQLTNLSKKPSEEVQPTKRVAIRHKASGAVYVGDAARQMLGLSSTDTVKVRYNHNPDYDVFIESTSSNRILYPGQDLMVTEAR